MVDVVKFLLISNYYYARFLGAINFEIDFSTGRARITPKATVYAALINLLVFSAVPILAQGKIWDVFWQEMNKFHEYVFLVAMLIRICCVFMTILSRWWQRYQIVELLGSFRRLVLQQPQVMRLWRRGVIIKSITGCLTETIHTVLILNGLRGNLTPPLTVSVLAMSTLIAVLNIVISQYYFTLLNLHAHYLLINRELRSILIATRSLQSDNRIGVRHVKSCELADRMDKLARLQYQMQTLTHRMSAIFGIQTLSMGIICYISIIAGVYYAYLMDKHNMMKVEVFRWNNLLLMVGVTVYLLDIHFTYTIIYLVLDRHDEMKELIMSNSTLDHAMDIRLQRAFENFQLQLIKNPLKLSVLGIYSLSRAIVVSMISSVISYSVILIQYDMKNF